jgi:peptide chain release factor 2
MESQMAAPDFWNQTEKAQATIQKLKQVKSLVAPLADAKQSAADLEGMLELSEGDSAMEAEVAREIERLEEVVEDLELKALLNGPNDDAVALVTINARDGGTDANDWAEMLLRMYSQWAQKHDYAVELLSRQENIEAGINNATIAVRGPMAFGYLKGEEGVHRLVRISPFNSEGKRQTSFAAVDVTAEVDDSFEVDLKVADVREDVFRAGGAGGQHVNKTSSAIRLTHMPTNTVVVCQNERSQHQNRALAYKLLRAKLARLEEEAREAKQTAKYMSKARTGFGSQIRNYFLHPDQRVKDTRTGHLVGNFHSVLDGNQLQGFLDAFLRWNARKGEPAATGSDDEDD